MSKEQSLIGHKDAAQPNAALVTRLTNENQRLVHEVKVLRNQNREKDDEITRLHVYILQKSRLKNLIKDFILKIDSIITLQLTKKLKRRKYYPSIHIKRGEADPAVVLTVLARSDQAAFVMDPPLGYRVQIMFIKASYLTYRTVRRALYRPLRAARRKMLQGQQGQ